MKKIFLLVVTVLMVFCGCSKKDSNPVNSFDPNNPSLAGSWRGTGGFLVIEMNLNQSGTSIAGSGTMQSAIACTVSGTNNYPDVSLTFSVTGTQPTVFSGSFSHKDTVSGKLNGSGFTNYDLIFVRQ